MPRMGLSRSIQPQYSFACRFSEETGLRGAAFRAHYLFDLEYTGQTPPVSLQQAEALLNTAITSILEEYQPFLTGWYVGANDTVLLSLANSLYGGSAALILDAKIREKLSEDGYWISRNTIPDMLVGALDVIVLQEPFTLNTVKEFLPDQWAAEVSNFNLNRRTNWPDNLTVVYDVEGPWTPYIP